MSDYLRMIYENEENEKEVKKLTKQNEKLKEKITALKKEIKELKKEIKELKKLLIKAESKSSFLILP